MKTMKLEIYSRTCRKLDCSRRTKGRIRLPSHRIWPPPTRGGGLASNLHARTCTTGILSIFVGQKPSKISPLPPIIAIFGGFQPSTLTILKIAYFWRPFSAAENNTIYGGFFIFGGAIIFGGYIYFQRLFTDRRK